MEILPASSVVAWSAEDPAKGHVGSHQRQAWHAEELVDEDSDATVATGGGKFVCTSVGSLVKSLCNGEKEKE